MAVTGLNFFPGDMAGGDRGLVTWIGREDEFADSVASAMALGERLGCRRFNALYGNRIEGVDAAEQDKLGLANLALASEAAERIGAQEGDRAPARSGRHWSGRARRPSGPRGRCSWRS